MTASGGSLKYATAAGAWASFTFSGSSIAWVAYKGPTRGNASVYLDGVFYATVSLYASTCIAKQIVYAAAWGSSGTHTMKVVVAGTSGHPRVDVDAFVRLINLSSIRPIPRIRRPARRPTAGRTRAARPPARA